MTTALASVLDGLGLFVSTFWGLRTGRFAATFEVVTSAMICMTRSLMFCFLAIHRHARVEAGTGSTLCDGFHPYIGSYFTNSSMDHVLDSTWQLNNSDFIMMDSVFALVSSILLIFSIHFVFTIANTLEFSSMQPKRLVTKLIHRDSIASPYYSSDLTVEDRAQHSMRSSLARIAYLYANMKRDSDLDDLWLSLHPGAYEPLLLVNFSMGEPPVPQLAIMDTGSSLLWIQCAPCKGCSQQTTRPVFDPSKSSTYDTLSCKNIICRYAPRGDCNPSNQCVYNQTYVEGLSSVGVIATEQVIFGSLDEGINSVSNVLFGCSHMNGNYKDRRFTGVFGLGGGFTSLVTHMGSKFSYCLGNIADPYYSYNQLVFGQGANMEGYSTPLEVVDGHYQVILEGISVGERRLVIDPGSSKRKGKGKIVIIDSGTAPTWLAENEYRALDKEVRSLLDRFLTPFWQKSFLCYKGIVNQDLVGFPTVTFHFAEGADLVADSESMFYQATPEVFCMAVRQTIAYGKDFQDLSVIGIMAQQYYNMGYDLNSCRLFFQRIDCELLDE